MEENVEEYEVVELEYSEDDILYYIVDENDEEIGFAILEDGEEVEYYYEGFDGADYDVVEVIDEIAEPEPEPAAPKEKSYLGKLATIAGAEAGKLRDKAEVKVDDLRGKAEVKADKAAGIAKEKAAKLKGKADDEGITRESVAEATADLNQIARDGAEVAAELKGAYDDIMESFGFLKKKR